MSDVVRPQDVLEGDLREKLKEAVISAYMATEVIDSAQGHSVRKYIRMEEKGGGLRFHYEATILGEEGYPVYCDYPSSDWDLNNMGPNLGDYPGFTGIDATGAWQSLKESVDSWLDPWVHDCPNPNDFTNQINSMARIASQLNIGGDSGSGPPGGDTDLREAVKTISNRSYGKGAAIVAFRDAYSSDLWTTINNQCGMTAAAGLALTAEGAAWSETYRTLRDFVRVAIHDFGTLADAPGNENGAAALAATAAVAGILGATAGAVFPPFGAAMGGLGAVIGIYTVMNPAVPAVDRSPLKLSGGHFDSMWTSFTEQLRTISDDLAAAERAVSRGCRRVMNDTNENPESYSLTRNTRKGKQYDDFDGLQVQEIDLSQANLRKMSGAAEVIGDQQSKLGGFLLGDDAQGNPAAQAYREWSRGRLPDGTRIGLDDGDGEGPYRTFQNLVHALSTLLKEEGQNSRRMATALMKTALDFSDTDQLSADEQRRLRRQIDNQADKQDHNPLVRGNDPSDPWYQDHS